ncbi:MAG: flagellar protein FlgN [Rhodocyclaceae bacterium]|nr:flagellar protein FlgN [Rhodocyclaceae bacterium]
MSERLPDRQFLSRLLQEESALLDDFVALLKQEEALLLDGQTDALLEMADRKTALYRRLQFLSDERSRAFAGVHLTLDDASMRRALQGAPDALRNWDRILDLAGQAAERNTSNGRLISERMQHNQQALTVLMAAAAQPGATYGPDGQSRPFISGRRFGSV